MQVKRTVSLCPTCYREVPGVVTIEDGVVRMNKLCPAHGESSGVLEVDPRFYLYCLEHPSPIYAGHLIDVTTRCNLSCKYCYFAVGNEDVPTAEVVNECMVNSGPFILTGGEPTLRPDLPEIIQKCSCIGPTYFLTNGTGLLDPDYLMACNEHVFKYNGFSGIGLSYHAEFGRFDEVMDTLRAYEVKPHTVFFVIDSIDQLEDVARFGEANKGFIDIIRIKCASNVWNESGAGRVYASEVLNWFNARGQVLTPSGGKTVYFPFAQNGVTYSVISWHDVTNVDLLDIACPPTYRAKNGEVTDFVKAMLINEGLRKGWRKGALCP